MPHRSPLPRLKRPVKNDKETWSNQVPLPRHLLARTCACCAVRVLPLIDTFVARRAACCPPSWPATSRGASASTTVLSRPRPVSACRSTLPCSPPPGTPSQKRSEQPPIQSQRRHTTPADPLSALAQAHMRVPCCPEPQNHGHTEAATHQRRRSAARTSPARAAAAACEPDVVQQRPHRGGAALKAALHLPHQAKPRRQLARCVARRVAPAHGVALGLHAVWGAGRQIVWGRRMLWPSGCRWRGAWGVGRQGMWDMA
eukprot:365395-Chlamydomonas_euryale.AAC.4